MRINWVVQAKCYPDGWMDSKTAETREEAERLQAELLANDDAWMKGDYTRETRIMPVEASKCWDRYNRVESPRKCPCGAILPDSGPGMCQECRDYIENNR